MAGQGLLGRGCGPGPEGGGWGGRGGSPQGSQLGFCFWHRNSAICLGAMCRAPGMRQCSEGGISEKIPSCTPQSVACRPGLGITWELVRNAGPLRRKGSLQSHRESVAGPRYPDLSSCHRPYFLLGTPGKDACTPCPGTRNPAGTSPKAMPPCGRPSCWPVGPFPSAALGANPQSPGRQGPVVSVPFAHCRLSGLGQ